MQEDLFTIALKGNVYAFMFGNIVSIDIDNQLFTKTSNHKKASHRGINSRLKDVCINRTTIRSEH